MEAPSAFAETHEFSAIYNDLVIGLRGGADRDWPPHYPFQCVLPVSRFRAKRQPERDISKLPSEEERILRHLVNGAAD